MSTYFDREERQFNSLVECVDHIRQYYPDNQKIHLTSKDIDSGKSGEIQAPAFLYRGESYAFTSTTSSMGRIRQNESLPLKTRQLLQAITQKADAELQDFFNLSPMLSAGFLQHYGMPTELLDVSSSLDVAAYFASEGKVNSKGLICILPVQVIAENSMIIDLTQHPAAERPRRQLAYAFYHRHFEDIKESECIRQLKLSWFAFTLKKSDKVKYQSFKYLLDAHTDKVAGVLQLVLDDFDKFDDQVARWLADRVAPAPFVTRAIDYYEHAPKQPKTLELISLEDAGMPYDEKAERENNYRKWSSALPEIRPHKLTR